MVSHDNVMQFIYLEVLDVTCCVRQQLLVHAETPALVAPPVDDWLEGLVAITATIGHRQVILKHTT